MQVATRAFSLALLLATTLALAGEPGSRAAPKAKAPPTGAEPSDESTAPATSAGGGPAAPPSTAAPAPTPPAEEPAEEVDPPSSRHTTIRGRTLWETFSRGGPLMYPILFCSFVGLAFAIERLVSLRKSAVAPRGLAEAALAAAREKGSDAAIAACMERPSSLGRILTAGLAMAGASRQEINSAMEEAGERELWQLERFAKPLSIIAGVAPLLGLLGTVWGMIMAFDVVAAKGALGDPRQLAEGIGTALLTTFAGLTVAIPSYVLYHYFRSKSDHMVVEIEETASHMAAQLQEASSHANPSPAGGGRELAPDAAD